MVEMMNIACGETEQSFHLNASTYTRTGNPLLLFFEHKSTAMPNTNKASAHPEPLPIRQSTGSSQQYNDSNCVQFQSYRPSVSLTRQQFNFRQPAMPCDTELLEERMEDWAGTFFISHLPLSFALLALLALHRRLGLDPHHPLY
jgi:hypothetical protein